MKQIILGIALSFVLSAQAPDRAEVRLQAAVNRETVEGDLKGAIDLYRKLAVEYRANRSVASRALLRLAQAQEKLGQSEVRNVYEQIVRDYGDQQPAVVARARLAALSAGSQGISARRIAGVPLSFTGFANPISTNGRYLFTASQEDGAWIPAILDLSNGERRNLPKPANLSYIDTGIVSSDGQSIAYTGQPSPGKLDLLFVDFNGSNPRTLLHSSQDVSWFYPIGITPDKREIAILFNRQGAAGYHLGRVNVASGALTPIKEFSGVRLGQGHLSPDGKWIAYSLQQSPSGPNQDIFLIGMDGSSESTLVEHAGDDTWPVWSSDNQGVFFATNRGGSKDLWFAPVRAGKGIAGQKSLKQGVGQIRLLGSMASGSLVYLATSGAVTFLHGTIEESTGKLRAVRTLNESFTGTKLWPKLSPDEKQLAYVRRPDYAEDRAIVGIRDLASGREREVFPSLRQIQHVLWMPDQRSLLLVGTDHGGEAGDFLLDLSSGLTKRIPGSRREGEYARGGGAPVLSPDGKTLYSPYFKTASGALFAKDIASGSSRLLVEGNGYTNIPSISPDGKWLAFLDNGTQRRVGRIVSIPDGAAGAGAAVRDLPEGIFVQGWAKDSKSVYVTSEKEQVAQNPGQKRTLRLFRMELNGGPLVPVSEAIDYSFADSMHMVGNSLVYRENRTQQEVWAFDNPLPAIK